MRHVSRDSVFVEGGRALYVFQEVLEPNTRGDVLLAGYISFLLERGADGIWRSVRKDSTFGAFLPREGEPVVVPAPIPTRLIAAPRAVARPDGTWAVVFAETYDYTGDSPPDSAARLWYGVLDGARWTHLEQIPMPAGGRMMTYNAGPPVLRGDTLFWALTYRAPLHDVAVFARRGPEWTHEIVRSFFAFYPRLAYSDTLGLVLATVGSGGNARAAENLFLWTKRPEWKPLVLLVPEEREKVMDPWLSLESGRELVSWAGVDVTADGAWLQARVLAGRLDPSSSVTVLDTAISGWGDFPVRPAGQRGPSRFWALEHVVSEDEGVVRIGQEVGGGVYPRVVSHAPFISGFMSTMPDSASLLVAGGVFDPARQLPVSLGLRFAIECPSPPE